MENLLPFEKKQRKIFVKRDLETNPNHGCDPEQRPVDVLLNYGIVNLDKYKGPTSHEVTSFLKKILNVKKAGHSGTLDPAVTGVLPIAIGRATRIVDSLLKSGKEYVAIMHLHKEVKEDRLKEGFEKFTGKIRQMPPIKSAVKRQWRFRNVYYTEILEINEKDVLFKIGCEAGTYIRKFIHDLGQYLGTGAHMAELRRTKAGCFTEEKNLVTLQDVSDALHYYHEEKNEKFIRHCVQPIEHAVEHLPKVYAADSAVDVLCNGVNLKIPGIAKLEELEKDETVAVMTLKNELIAIGTAQLVYNKILEQDKGTAVKINKVFMERGTYTN